MGTGGDCLALPFSIDVYTPTGDSLKEIIHKLNLSSAQVTDAAVLVHPSQQLLFQVFSEKISVMYVKGKFSLSCK